MQYKQKNCKQKSGQVNTRASVRSVENQDISLPPELHVQVQC